MTLTANTICILAAILLLCLGMLFLAIRAGKRKNSRQPESDEGYIDIHTHILPGVDDGAEDMETAIKMVELLYHQGVRKIITTPHYAIGQEKKTAAELREIFDNLRQEAERRFEGMELYLGNEIYYSDGIEERIRDGRALTLAGSRYVLVEYNVGESYSRIRNSVISLQRQGLWPVIAHVERYQSVMKDSKNLQELKNMGVMLQMNCSVVKRHLKYIKEGVIDLLATDCHGPEYRPPNMGQAVRVLNEQCDPLIREAVLRENAETILRDMKENESTKER